MEWSEVINNPVLQNLPFKIETNEWGQIVMSAATNKHGFLQIEIAVLLRERGSDGRSLSECSIQTARGVKVADVVWGSRKFFEKHGYETPYQESPEICVEIASPSNSKREMREKRKPYFDQGAAEIWICYESGKVEFYNAQGEIKQSSLFPDFPNKIEITLR